MARDNHKCPSYAKAGYTDATDSDHLQASRLCTEGQDMMPIARDARFLKVD